MAADTLFALYDGLRARLRNATTIPQGTAVLDEWNNTTDFRAGPYGYATFNDYRINVLWRAVEQVGYPLPLNFAEANRLVTTSPWNKNQYREHMREWAIRRELPAMFAAARADWNERKTDFSLQVAEQIVVQVQEIAQVVDDVSANLSELASVTTEIIQYVEMPDDVRAELTARLDSLRGNRERQQQRIVSIVDALLRIEQDLQTGTLVTSADGKKYLTAGQKTLLVIGAGAGIATVFKVIR